jgi:hypothetical protein
MSQPKKASRVNPNQPPGEAGAPKAAVYRGRVYVRPVERGVVLRDAGTGEFEMYLDNFAALIGLGDKFADGECKLEITIRRLDAPPAEIGIFEADTDPTPSAHKSLHDYQQQLEAKRKRKKVPGK